MSKRMEGLLEEGEKVVLSIKRSWWKVAISIISSIASLILIIIYFPSISSLYEGESIGLIYSIIYYVAIIAVPLSIIHIILNVVITDCVITDKRVIGKSGILPKTAFAVPVEKVTVAGMQTGNKNGEATGMALMIEGESKPRKFSFVKNTIEMQALIAQEGKKIEAEKIAKEMANSTEVK